MITLSIIKYNNANVLEATWKDGDSIVKCQSYADVQMDMLRVDALAMGTPLTEYEPIISGVIANIVPIPSEQLLANTKEAKLQELETAFVTASKLPVAVGTKTYNGGKESAQALRDYIQLVTESGGTSFTIWDSSNSISTYTLAEATAIKLAVATAVAQGEFNLRIKKNAVNDAMTITAVNAVTY